MKLTILALILSASAAIADTKVIDGCEVTQASNGNYFYKVDGSCQFNRDGIGDRGDGKLNPVNFPEE